MCRSSSPGRWNFLLRADPRASAGKGFVVFTGHGQNDAGGHFHHETLGQLRHVNEPILMHPDIDESTEVRDICDRGGRRSGRKRPLLPDIRQTNNPLCAVSDLSLAASSNGRTVCDTPSHPPGEWPTSANERYLLQKLSLFRVAAFFIADVGNGLILSCGSEFEFSVCSFLILLRILS
jgi:hypothetical protein